MPILRSILAGIAGLVASLPLLAQAQAPNLAGATYFSVEAGTGKVGLNCPANTDCSRVDASGVVRIGHRIDPAWAFEVTYSHISADWGVLNYNYSAEHTGFGLGAAYVMPLSDRVSLQARFGGMSNEIKLQPAVGIGSKNPGTISTRSVKPYVGLGLSWQFAQHWSTSLNVGWTRADLREAANGPKQGVTVQTAGVGIGFNF